MAFSQGLNTAMTDRLPVYAAALWWGSLSVIGFMAVPLLFASLPSKALAGHAAAQLFAAQTWVSVACGVVLLLAHRQNRALAPANQAPIAIVFVIFGMLLALLLEYAVAPRIMARQNLRLWHSLGATLYAVQWLSAAVVLWPLAGRRGGSSA